MQPLLYSELVSWYRLVDPTEDHQDEAASYQAALESAASPSPQTLFCTLNRPLRADALAQP